jgi:hypothetical protein
LEAKGATGQNSIMGFVQVKLLPEIASSICAHDKISFNGTVIIDK